MSDKNDKPKYIREGRMGPPLTYKTGAVVSTYPRPLLVFEFDLGGLDVIKDPIVHITPSEIDKYCQPGAQLPPILAVNFSENLSLELDLAIKSYDPTKANNVLDAVNKVVRATVKAKACPWRTIIVDHITGLSEAFVGYIGANDSKAMEDARNWAYKAGVLVQRAIMVIQGLPCHTVFIMHTETEKNEVTGEINTEPMILSKLRQRAAGLFSQFFYAQIEMGKAIVYAQPTGFVKSVGMRKPEQAPAKLGATFKEIYGSEYQ